MDDATAPHTNTAPARTSPPAAAPKASAAVWGASVVGWLLMFAGFEPLGWSPLAWFSLVPLCLLAGAAVLPKRSYLAAYVGGLLWAVPSIAWMRLADPMMWLAWFALSAYMAAYFPLFVAACRVAVRFVPLTVAAGVVWMGLELVRCRLMSGFPWYLLGHTQHEWTTLCQIADVGGATLISGLMAAFAGVTVEAGGPALFARLRLPPPPGAGSRFARSAVGFGVLLAVSLTYGKVRLNQTAFTAGPRVALVQGNFPSRLKQDRNMAPLMQRVHSRLTEIATSEQPEVIIWPETMFPYSLLEVERDVPADLITRLFGDGPERVREEAERRQELLANLSLRSGAALVVGVMRVAVAAEDAVDPFRNFNSALYVTPEGVLDGDYAKIHRVPFGEYIPMSDWFPFLRRISFVGGGLFAGESVRAFKHPEATLIPNICFEDTVPELTAESVRAAPGGEDRGLIVNLTNDGWFHGSSELEQHLITASFRCIETRTPMARAVNTGISAFIDGNGVIMEPEVMLNADAAVPSPDSPSGDGEVVPVTMRDDSGEYRRQFNGVLVTDVPLDPRGSVYLVIGDLVSILAAAFCVLMLVIGGAEWFAERRARKARAGQ